MGIMRGEVGAFAFQRPAAAVVFSLFLSALVQGCIPITLSTHHVEADTRSEPVAAGWDPTIGPDVNMAFAYSFKEILRAESKLIEVVDGDVFWSAIVPQRQPGSVAKVSEVLSTQSLAAMSALGIRFLVVLGKETSTGRVTVTDLGPFYSKSTVETTREAAVIDMSGASADWLNLVAKASDVEKEGWIPGTPLMLTRLYQIADTEQSALKGLGRRVAEHLMHEPGTASVRVAVLAMQ